MTQAALCPSQQQEETAKSPARVCERVKVQSGGLQDVAREEFWPWFLRREQEATRTSFARRILDSWEQDSHAVTHCFLREPGEDSGCSC